MNKNIQIIIAVIAILIVGGVIYAGTPGLKSNQKLVTSPKVVDMGDWKTYTNLEKGINLSYPSTWKIEEQPKATERWYVRITNPAQNIKPDTDQPRDQILIQKGCASIANKKWEIGFAGSLYRQECINGFEIVMGAIDSDSKTNIDYILSTFKFNSPKTDNNLVASQIKITSPKVGDVYKLGDVMNIKWDARQISKDVTVAGVGINLIDANGVVIKISQGSPNIGSYEWKIPTIKQESGTDIPVKPGTYQISVYGTGSATGIGAKSESFNITN